jgi:asparagine synthase (glutamine-hydrolysing)
MCGIAGILELGGREPSRDVLAAMGRRMRHRGPDGEGVHRDGPCGLVHRRLAILDPSRGHQPLSNEDGTIWITYNGEIYNSPELRRRLESAGHRFRTTTDTEVIVHAYEEDPEGFVEAFNGIFAFAIWDSRRQRLVLARDYIGVKPLYVHRGPECFVFGSEVKALLADPRVPCEPDPRAMAEVLAFQNTYFGRTCFQDIALVEPGEMMVVAADGSIRKRKYWTFRPQEPSRLPRAEAARELRGLVETVVRDQLLSDVPVATYLSGGMDTGTLTALARPMLPDLETFSGGFVLEGVPESLRNYDERDAAFMMSGRFGTHHHFREIAPADLVDSFQAIAWHLEEPRGSTCYAPFVMAREAGRAVKVILSGHGGDELFAGYQAKYRLAEQYGSDWENRWFADLNYLVPRSQASAWLNPDLATPELLAWPREVFDSFVAGSRGMTPTARAQHHDLFVYMQGLLLIEDKLSMAHSLESRVPFLDRRLFDFAWSLHDDWKLSATKGKVLLRESLDGVLPAEILARDKMGFGPPDNHYFRTSLRPWLAHLLLDCGFDGRGIVRPEVVREFLHRQDAGHDLQQHLWTFVSLEMWHRSFMDRTSELRARPGEAETSPVALRLPAAVVATARKPPTLAACVPAPSLSTRMRRQAGRGARFSLRAAKFAARLPLRGTRFALRQVRALPKRCKDLARRAVKRVARWVLPATMRDAMRTSWGLLSGAYANRMRPKLEAMVAKMKLDPAGGPLRLFQGLYHAPQPVFLVQAFRDQGHEAIYETIDLNPGFPMVDVHHKMHHPDFYREHAEVLDNTLLQTNPTATTAGNLDELEKFFTERWPKYDVFHFNWFASFLPDNLDVEFLRASGRPVYFHFRGCFVLTKIVADFTLRGESVADACRHCRKCGWRDQYFNRFFRGVDHASRVFASTPNLCHCSPDFEYIPNSLEPSMEATPPVYASWQRKAGPIVVLHAPAHENVRGYKGTACVRQAVEQLQKEGLDVELKLIQKMSRAEAVRCYGQGDVFVEQLHLGSYGNTAIEAMAHGMPVISSNHPSHAHLTPGCPVVHADPVTLTDRLREVARDFDLRVELGRRSYEWVRQFHANDRVAAHLVRIYEEDLGLRAAGPRNTLGNLRPSYDGVEPADPRLPRAA